MSALADQAAGPLPRKAMLGAALGPLKAELRSKMKSPADGGVAIITVLPGTSAEAAGLNAGDVIRTIDGKPVASPEEVIALVGRKKAGDRLSMEVLRDGKHITKPVELREKGRRKGDGFAVLYDSVTSRGHRLRTIVSKPGDAGRHPAVLLIQGLGNFSIDNPTARPGSYDKILDELTRGGYVTLRVDKPGCGDSEGGPWPEIDFMTELDGYREGLKALKAYAFVDPERVFLFGHSMGGVMAPLLASEIGVKGVAVYGTVFRTWFEYQVENVRRQSRLAGDDFAMVERNVRNETLFDSELFLTKKSPSEIVKTHPELRQYLGGFLKDDKYMFGGHYTFFQQLADLDLPKAWAKTDAHVLALWGKGDFVAPGPDHEMIAEAVNSVHPGRGAFRVLDCDHGFSRSSGFKESIARFSGKSEGEFNPVIITTLKEWMDRACQASP
jgi:pimeloyl-ACP methyl ester carboxylesterase